MRLRRPSVKKSTKKRLLIAGIVFAVLVIGGVVAFNVAVNKMFSKVTQTISDSDLLKDNGSVELPVVTEGMMQARQKILK